jgi:2-methylcitrate dehydratase PrpD
MASAAERLAAFATSLGYEEIPPEVARAAKLHLLDTLGCGLAAHALGLAGEGRRAMAEMGGEPEATVIGLSLRLPAANAAFANAMLCHGLDFDDTHPDSVSHVSTVVGPAALAAGEAAAASGRETLAAIVVGNETVSRIGMAAPGAFHKRGFHPTAVCGVFAAAAAAARLAGLDLERATSALGLAGSLASGIFAYLEDGTPTKPLHPAWAAHGGLLAARLAALGAEGPPSVLEGKFGLYHAFLGAGKGEVDIDGQLADLGERWETLRIAFKPYPACHFMHGALGAAEELAPGIDPEDIEEVVVTVPPQGVALVLEPAATKMAPRSEYEGKFSLQYSAAAMLVHGRVGIATYREEALRDPRVLALAQRVRYETRDYPTYPQAFPGGIRLRLRDGRQLSAEHPYQLGSPENPMSEEAVREKFRANAAGALPADAVGELEAGIMALEEAAEVGQALAALRLLGEEARL